MNTYEIIYREAGHQSKVVRQQVQGHAEALVRRDMEAQGNQVLAIIPLGESSGFAGRLKKALTGNLNLSLRFGVSTAELALLCEVLRALYASGVPMLESFRIVIDETPNAWLKKRLIIVLERLRDGADVYTAMSDPRCRKAFPPLMRETIRTGEVSGRLDRSLERMGELFKRASETKRQTVSALLYPAITILVFIGVCGAVAWLVPNAMEEFVGEDDLEAIWSQVPAQIRFLFWLRDNSLFLIIPPSLIAGVSLFWVLGKRLRATRSALTRLERRMPLVGKLLYQFALVRFLDLLASNNESGIEMPESLRLVRNSVGDALISESLERVRTRIVTKGQGLGEALSDPQEIPVYPGLVRQMVRAGEESGRLTQMLLPIVDFYNGQAKATLQRLLDSLTPLMIILLGSVIGPIIAGVYQTMYALQTLYG